MSNNIKKESFFKRYKNDSRCRAKVQLLGGCLFILFLIIWINISYVGSYDGLNFINITNTVDEYNSGIINDLRKNNYSCKIEVIKTSANVDDVVVYDGMIYNNTKLVTKIYGDLTEKYYISGNNYYLFNNGAYVLTNSSKYYDFIASTFMNLNSVIDYINVGKLASTDNSIDGKVIKVYNVLLKDISLVSGEGYITINVVEDNINNSIEFNVDYTNLYNIYDINKLDSLILKYNINNIGKIEEFKDIIIK